MLFGQRTNGSNRITSLGYKWMYQSWQANGKEKRHQEPVKSDILVLSPSIVSHCPPSFYLPCAFSKCPISISQRIFPLPSILADRDDDSPLSLLPQLQGASVRDPAVLGVMWNTETVSWSVSEQLQPQSMSNISPWGQLQKMDHASACILNTRSQHQECPKQWGAMGNLPEQTLICHS